MLIRFTVENFLSFHERIDFNMLASPEAAHPHHVLTNGEDGLGILRTSLMYGANASGKSNLIRAMHFARKFCEQDVQALENRRLHFFDSNMTETPHRFCIPARRFLSRLPPRVIPSLIIRLQLFKPHGF